MPRVTAKPLIGPEPKIYKKSAANRVVRFESIIVEIARLYPLSIAGIAERPFLSSSRIRSKIKTFASTAIPIVKTMPAIPGRVNVACRVDNSAIIRMILKIT